MPEITYDLRTLLETQRQLMPLRTFLRDTFTVKGKTFPTQSVEIEYMKGRRRVAPYVSDLLPGKVVSRDARQIKTFTPALIKPARPITAIDLNQRSFGENPYSLRTPEERAEEILADDIVDLNNQIIRREEVALSELIFTGKVTQVGEGVEQVLDYNLTNKEILTGAALWTVGSPVTNLQAWQQAVARESGGNVGVLVMAPDVVMPFLENPSIQKLLDNKGFTLGSIAPRPSVGGATYIGRLNYPGVDIWSYNEWYLDDNDLDGQGNPKQKPMIPAGYVAYLPTEASFRVHYGAITVMGDDDQFVTIEGERVPYSWAQKSPAQRWLEIHSRPLPVPQNVDGWFVAKVI